MPNLTYGLVAENVGFVEGPVATQKGSILFTSITRGLVYEALDGEVRVFGDTGGGPNGATEGPGGDIYIAQNGGHWPARPGVGGGNAEPGVQRISPTGEVTTVSAGEMLSPNDLAFGPDGYLYVTDPTRDGARGDGRIWRCNIETGECQVAARTSWYTNGIGFTRDAGFVADTGGSRIVRFEITDDGLEEADAAVDMKEHRWHPDGFVFDTELNIIIACPAADYGANGQIQVYSASGKLIDRIDIDPPAAAPRPLGRNRYTTNCTLTQERELIVADSSGGAILKLGGWPSAPLGLHPFVS